MGLVGSGFTGGTAMLGFLLAAEVIAATAVVSEAALIYVARTRNMIISLVMLAIEAGLAAALILIMRDEGLPAGVPGDRPGDRPVRRARLRLDHQVVAAEAASSASRYRAGAGTSPGRRPRASPSACRRAVSCPRLWQLIVGVPAILAAFGAVLWTKGFGPEDRELFRLEQGRRARSCAKPRKPPRARPGRGRYRLQSAAQSL